MKLEKYYRTKTAGLEGQPNKKKNKRMADIVAVNVKYVLDSRHYVSISFKSVRYDRRAEGGCRK